MLSLQVWVCLILESTGNYNTYLIYLITLYLVKNGVLRSDGGNIYCKKCSTDQMFHVSPLISMLCIIHIII